jgi:surface protein
MANMFDGTSALTTLNLTNFKTDNVTTMAYMFSATALTTLDLHSWNVDTVTSFSTMFASAIQLTTFNLSGWGSSRTATNVNMSYMFQHASALSSLNITNFSTTNVTNMNSMFHGTISLTSLDVSNWDVSQVTSFGNMFHSARNLGTLDLSGWNTGAGADKTAGMFYNTTNLWKINLGENTRFAVDPSLQSAPTIGTTIIDNGQNYKTTTASWQEVGSGTAHNPKGTLVSTTDMWNSEATRPVTYVWAQAPTIDAASNIVFGTLNASDFGGGKLPIATNMSTGKLDLINLEATITYDITVSQTSDWEANGTTDKITRHDLKLMYGDDELSDHATTFWQGQSENSQKSVSLSHNPDKSFRLSLNPATIIKSSLLDKQMQSTLTWSFNDTPS